MLSSTSFFLLRSCTFELSPPSSNESFSTVSLSTLAESLTNSFCFTNFNSLPLILQNTKPHPLTTPTIKIKLVFYKKFILLLEWIELKWRRLLLISRDTGILTALFGHLFQSLHGLYLSLGTWAYVPRLVLSETSLVLILCLRITWGSVTPPCIGSWIPRTPRPRPGTVLFARPRTSILKGCTTCSVITAILTLHVLWIWWGITGPRLGICSSWRFYMLFKGKFVGKSGFLKTWAPFIVLSVISIVVILVATVVRQTAT